MVIGQIISIFGAAILRFALSTYVLDITGRSDLFALVFAVSSIPGIILSPIGGAIADRFNRRNLMVIFDFTSCLIVLVSGILFWQGIFSVLIVAVIMTLLAIISFIYQPAVHASIPVLSSMENIESANGIVSGVAALSSLAAPVLGGVLYGILGMKSLIIVSCIAFFLSAVMEIFIKIPFEKREVKKHIITDMFSDIKDGAFYVLKTKPYIFKIMMVALLLNLFLVPFFIVGVPYMLRITMSSSDTFYGIGLGIVQLSSIIGALTVGLVAKKMQLNNIYKWVILISILFFPMSLAMFPKVLSFGYYPSFIMLFLFSVPIMMVTSMLSIVVISLVQKETPNELIGKVMAIIVAVAQCAAPLGQILYGTLLEFFRNAVYIPIIIIGFMGLGIAVVTNKLFRDYN